MSSDIQFGEVQEAEPRRGVRPDQDAHFHVALVREFTERKPGAARQEGGASDVPVATEDSPPRVPDEDLLIFVDLDVMRDMEAHAESNTRVELGGVMLGYQQLDRQGRPFVVVTDSLRAEHYEATKGSFKFTHDTWSQITEQRAEFHPDLEMVGWYHTHPGWGVFLSGMDLFICNHFFNRELDIALVIDPVSRERGWFQWDEGPPGGRATRRTKQFFLMASRFRRDEVEYFASLYREGPPMVDPRYSQPASFGSSQPVVNIMEGRKTVGDVAVLAMLTMQFILLALLAWKVIGNPPLPENRTGDSADSQLAIRQQAYDEVLQVIVDKDAGGPQQVVRDYVELRQQNRRLTASLDSQISYLEQLRRENSGTQAKLNEKTELADALATQLAAANNRLNQIKKAESVGTSDSGGGQTDNTYWWWIGGGGLSAGLLVLVSFLVGVRRGRSVTYRELDEVAEVAKTDKKIKMSGRQKATSPPAGDPEDSPQSINFTDE